MNKFEELLLGFIQGSARAIDGFKVCGRQVGSQILWEVWQGKERVIWEERDRYGLVEKFYSVHNAQTGILLNQLEVMLGKQPSFQVTDQLVKRNGRNQYRDKYRLRDNGMTFREIV